MPRVPAGVFTPARLSALAAFGAMALAGACSDGQPTGVATDPRAATPAHALAAFDCTASIATRAVRCTPSAVLNGQARGVIIGGQNANIKLTSSNVSYDSQSEIFQFDMTVQNLMNEAMGTPDGTVADPEGIQVFFESGPTTTSGSGSIEVANADGTDLFTRSNQPYFAYHEILAKDQVSSAKTWQLLMPATVGTFTFQLFVETDVQYLLVINELLVNPSGTTMETTGDWVELYNAGSRPVNLNGLVIADSAASGRRPYHLISQDLVVPSGGYVTVGGSTSSTTNGGATVDYSYGGALALASSLDAFKIARVYGTDTLTIDRTQYAQASTSAQDGVSRELKNPALDNSNMDGSNWASALVTATYSNGTVTNRGTPKAQNSTFTP
ncbi:lamin tail domain-containing protein [Longimicrobium sp.]|uniref:lamin tail domain-containing protein n=1 Tax=Longimicrobium sp. TaxID=2029185 RepID=UPI002C97A753|nr:lamin tail domain-containing protein [Longimicrobium sp.]HSU17258.1 lamin tail domain-containing protein [Longimicrobium sp.]